MTIYDFMSNSPFLTFFIALLIAIILEQVLFKLPNRYFRSKNIAAKGWPPSDCDADGDFKKKED